MFYFSLYVLDVVNVFMQKIEKSRRAVALFLVPAIAVLIAANTNGSHRDIIQSIESSCRWYGGWVMLGIASSIGLGTGLHTFMLFLGPFIARATITAAKCGNVDFDLQGAKR